MCGGGGKLLGAVLGGVAAYMTGGASLLAIPAVGAAGGALAGDTLIDKPQAAAEEGLKQQAAANQQAVDSANKQASLADQANNRANGKQPDIAGISGANMLSAKGGQSGTMLTGPMGIDPKALLLGKSTLLGG